MTNKRYSNFRIETFEVTVTCLGVATFNRERVRLFWGGGREIKRENDSGFFSYPELLNNLSKCSLFFHFSPVSRSFPCRLPFPFSSLLSTAKDNFIYSCLKETF